MKSESTRSVHKDMINLCKNNKVFKPFVDFVKNAEDLELCFRGNDSEMGTVTIYRHNHMVWKLTAVDKPLVEISTNHCRFMYDWDTYAIKGLLELGFSRSGNKFEDTYDDLAKAHLLATSNAKSEEENDGDESENDSEENKLNVTYNAVKLRLYITEEETEESIKRLIMGSYVIICRMQNEYFDPLGINTGFRNKNVNYDYLKAYCSGEEKKDIFEKIFSEKYTSNPQPCVEKHIQQEIFKYNNLMRNGLFVYDLEFAQPSKADMPTFENSANKPDMFAVRYNKNGVAKAICLVEVKSTESALKGKSGVTKHLAGMLEYASDKSLMDDRRKEAYQIIEQYKSLGLRGLSEDTKTDLDEFMKLPVEIIFIFSHGFNWATKITEDETVYQIIDKVNKDNNKKEKRLNAKSAVRFIQIKMSKDNKKTITAYKIELEEKRKSKKNSISE